MEKSSSCQDSTSSPVGVLEDYFRNVETDSNSSKESESDQKQRIISRWRGFVQKLRTRSKKVVETPPEFMPPPPGQYGSRPPGLGFLKLSRLSSSMRERIGGGVGRGRDGFGGSNGGGGSGLCDCDSSACKNFSLSEIQSATNNFSTENLIGKGGYAEVYKGRLLDGRIVAVKRLMKGTTEERIADFLTELGIMAHVDHPNTSKLIGYGFEGGMMHLVLEYSPLGSLASHLHGVKERIGWQVRYKVAIGTAEGLKYLHEECQRRIIHRDIKAANILLTRNFEPQICDFGLAKWLPEKWTHHTVSKFEGTFGYLAPEYLMHGIVDEKTDVFAFGVLLLELITGRRALDCSQQSLVLWAKPLLRKSSNIIREVIDPALGNDFDIRTMNLMLLAASICVQRSSIRRPTISQVLQLLKGNISSLDWKKTRKPSFWKRQYDPDDMTTQPNRGGGVL